MKSRAAFSVWRNLIAPVFDAAREIRILERSGNEIISEDVFICSSPSPWERVRLLREQQVQELYCGAISRPLFRMLRCCGIHVVPFITGAYQEIREAWICGRARHHAPSMPGCRNYLGYFADPGIYGKEGVPMSQQDRENSTGKGGPGQRWRRRGQGAGPGGYCVCKNCGHREPHKRGVPCSQEVCPRCGGPMYRE